MNVPADLLFTKEHEWVQVVSKKRVRVGISDFAQHQLGDITCIDLPGVDQPVSQFQPLAVVESIKAASDVYAPVSGTIVAVNESLKDQPELLNASPYRDGWICEIECKDEAELSRLMKAEQYQQHIK